MPELWRVSTLALELLWYVEEDVVERYRYVEMAPGIDVESQADSLIVRLS